MSTPSHAHNAFALTLFLAACSGDSSSTPSPMHGGSGHSAPQVAGSTPLAPAAGSSAAAAGRGGTGTSGTVAGTAASAGRGAMEAEDGGVDGAGTGAAGMPAGGTVAAGSGGAPAMQPSTGPFPPVTDFSKSGPFQSTTIDATGPNGNYTVYLPTELAANGAKNPIVGWMSGGGTNPALYTLLPHLATHGFVVVASNTIPGIGAEAMLGQEIIAGIEWAIAENERDGSMLFGKLDDTKIASAGYSMGSLATFMIASDPRLTTTVHISGGNMVAERVNNLRAPAAFLCGIASAGCADLLSADCDIAAANCDTDFAGAKTPVFYGNFPSGHLGILTSPHMERINAAATAWLRWQLMSDTTLKTMFVGDQCTLCKDPNWKVQQKNLQ